MCEGANRFIGSKYIYLENLEYLRTRFFEVSKKAEPIILAAYAPMSARR